MAYRILHVVGGMERGGVETWLMHVMRGTDPDEFRHDFLVHSAVTGYFEEEITASGGRILRCLHPEHVVQYVRCLYQTLRRDGPFDVVHSHVHHFSGITLLVAKLAGVPVRFSHSHTDTRGVDAQAGLGRRMYTDTLSRTIGHTATDLVACTKDSADALFGASQTTTSRLHLLPYGIDPRLFERPALVPSLRERLRIAPDALVVGHVGRFAEPKNHRFIVEIAAALLKREPGAVFALLGRGPLKETIIAQVEAADLSAAFRFVADEADDAPRLMRELFDVFLFPSLWEGVPIALLEAQAAGLPCVVSGAVSAEADVVPALVHRAALADGAEAWAEMVLHAHRYATLGPAEALALISASPFNVARSRDALYALYSSALAEAERPGTASEER